MASAFHRGEEAKEIADVNVVPLADVSLVLLIILLVLSPMMTQTMLRIQAAGKSRQAPPPPAQPEPDKPPELVLVVTMTPQGVSVGQRAFQGTADFISFMTAELSRRADRKVFVAPHPDVTHGAVVDMLEALRSCGASSAALVQTVDDSRTPPGPG